MAEEETSANRANEANRTTEEEHEFVPTLICYRSMRTKLSTAKGKRVHFQFSLDEVNLYHAKLKGKNPKKAVPIGNGSEAHYSHPDFLLIPDEEYATFTLKNDQDKDLMVAHFARIEGRKNTPKEIEATWYTDEGDAITLKNRLPEHTDSGTWCLDFDGRFAEPSIKNAIMIDPNTLEVQFMVRRMDAWEMNVDARREVPDLFLFTMLLCLNICPY